MTDAQLAIPLQESARHAAIAPGLAPTPMLAPGEALKAAGMADTLRAEPDDWSVAALLALVRFARARGTFTIEQFRLHWLAAGNPPPHSHKVWGAVTNAARRHGYIRATGQYRKAVSAATHAHPVMVWQVGDLAPVATLQHPQSAPVSPP